MRHLVVPGIVTLALVLASIAATAAPPKPMPMPAPTNVLPQKSPPFVPKLTIPATVKPATNVSVSPAGIGPVKGEDPLKPFLRRTYRGRGKCWVDADCIIIGRRLGTHAPGQPWPSSYRLKLTRIPDGQSHLETPTAWTENVIAFRRSQPGRYAVTIEDTARRALSNPFFVEIVARPPGRPDADGDNVKPIEFGGNDCDDFDRAIHPNAPQSVEDEMDHDCNPETFPVRDRDSDGEPDGLTCTVEVVGSGLDRVLEWTCGSDCDDENSSIRNGSMKCDPRSPTNIFVCRGKRKSRVDPRTPVTGIWEPYNCADFGGGTCVSQPNGTGSCR